MKKGKICIKILTKEASMVSSCSEIEIGWFKLKLWMWLVDLKWKFEYNWLIELSDSKLSDNKLASELVENRSFFFFFWTNDNQGKCNF